MSDLLLKRSMRIFLWVLFGVTIVLAVLYGINIQGADQSKAALEAAAEPALYWTYALILSAAALVVIFAILFVVRSPKQALKTLVALAILCGIVGISYALSSSAPLATGTQVITDPTVLRWSGTGIKTTYILAGIAVLLLIYSGIQGLFRK